MKTPSSKKKSSLTPEQFIAARERLGFKPRALAARMGVGLRTVQHWEAGTRPIPGYAQVLLDFIEAAASVKTPTSRK